jgi:putative sterol carrier protein
LLCADEEVFRKLLRGQLNPFIAAMRRWARMSGDRGFGVRVIFGLEAGSPFADEAEKEHLS